MTRRSPRKRILPDVQILVVPTKSIAPEAVAERKRMALYGFSQGKKRSEVAKDLGLAVQTVYFWEKSDPGYREQKERVLEERDAMLAEDFEETAFKMAEGHPSVTKKGLPHWPALARSLAVTNPKRWGDKKDVTHTHAVIHSLIPDAVRLDELPHNEIIEVIALDDGEEDG